MGDEHHINDDDGGDGGRRGNGQHGIGDGGKPRPRTPAPRWNEKYRAPAIPA